MGHLHLLIGTSAPLRYLARDTLLAGRRPDLQIDTTNGPAALLEAASSGGLFGDTTVEGSDGDKLDAATRRRLVDLLAEAPVTMLLHAETLTPTARKEFAAAAHATLHDTAPGKDPAWALRLFRAHGITVNGPARRAVTDAAHDAARVVQVLRQLLMAGLDNPNAAQLRVLFGERQAEQFAWTVAERVEAGDVAGAETAAAGTNPMALTGFLAKRVAQLGEISERGLDAEQAARDLRLSPHAARTLTARARRLGPDQLLAAARAVAVCDINAKQGDAAYAVTLLIHDLADLLGPTDGARRR